MIQGKGIFVKLRKLSTASYLENGLDFLPRLEHTLIVWCCIRARRLLTGMLV